MPKLGHVHIKVSDLDEAAEFYTGLFGLKVVEKVGNSYAFLSFGKSHHDIALQNVGSGARKPGERDIGLYHFAIEMESEKELAEVYFKLEKEGVECSPVDHGISKSIYLEDLDGNGIEVYVDTRSKGNEWGGNNRPLDFEKYRKQKN